VTFQISVGIVGAEIKEGKDPMDWPGITKSISTKASWDAFFLTNLVVSKKLVFHSMHFVTFSQTGIVGALVGATKL
jgi:hypothetical protein